MRTYFYLIKIGLAALLITFCYLGYSNDLIIPISLEERISKAELIVEGKIIRKNSFEEKGVIYTTHYIQVEQILKGMGSTDSVSFITLGGTVGEKSLHVFPKQEQDVGEKAIFFLYHTAKGLQLYAGSQGVIYLSKKENLAWDPTTIYKDPYRDIYRKINPKIRINKNKTEFIEEPLGISGCSVTINSFSPNSIVAGDDQVLTIMGSGFGASRGSGRVEFLDANSGGLTKYTLPSQEYLIWSDNIIQLKVPTNVATGTFEVFADCGSSAISPSTLIVPYALSTTIDATYGVKLLDLIDQDGSGGYRFSLNTVFAANTLAVDAFTRAMKTWKCATLVNWDIGGTTALNYSASDGVNVISFDATGMLPAGALGLAFIHTLNYCGSVYESYLTEVDLLFNTTGPWNYGPALPGPTQYDFETVALHELGHAHIINHVNDPTDLMYYAIPAGLYKRTLNANNIAAGNLMIARSIAPNTCDPPAPHVKAKSCTDQPPLVEIDTTVWSWGGNNNCYFKDVSLGVTIFSGTGPYTYRWLWGDGSPEHTTSYAGDYHVYSASGTYKVRLIVKNAFGSDTAYHTLKLVDPPTADFSFDVNNVCTGHDVKFTNLSTGPAGTTYHWDFGGLGTSTDTNPTFKFLSTGSHRVTLNAINGGCEVSTYKTIDIVAPTALANSIKYSIGCPCDNITFEALGAADSWVWDMGDGNTKSGASFTYKYDRPDYYIVTATGIQTSTGCRHVVRNVVPVCPGDKIEDSKADMHWVEGSNIYDFSSGNIALSGKSAISDFNEGYASMNDRFTGKLLFYSNGLIMFDRNHNPMPNGKGLYGDYTSSQSLTIIPFPNDINQYYIFTVRGGTSTDPTLPTHSFGIHYSVVNMSLNGGLGDVTIKNVPLFNEHCFGGVGMPYDPEWIAALAVQNCNSPDHYWLMYSACDKIHARLVDESGIHSPVVSPYSTIYFGASTAVFSPSGARFAVGGNTTYVFDFNQNTGLLSNRLELTAGDNTTAGINGVAFSPDNSKLYTRYGQFDLLAADVNASYVALEEMSEQRLASNGKVYYYKNSGVSVINKPNLPGLACNFTSTGLPSDIGHFQNIPNIHVVSGDSLNADFNPVINDCEVSVTNLTKLPPVHDPCSFYWNDTLRYEWDFGDGFRASTRNPSHTYTRPGTYNIRLLVNRDRLCIMDSITKNVKTCSSELPVKLVYFDALLNDKVVDIEWYTTAERNCKEYVIERSKDGINFEAMSKVNCSNSSSYKKYITADNFPYSGTSYYRLAQYDVDGKVYYSGIKVINFKDLSAYIFPNPSSSDFKVSLNGSEMDKVIIKILDIEGRVICEREENGNAQFTIGSSLSLGMYIVQLQDQTTVKIYKIIKE
jgi:PKD repeat protein